MAVLSDGSLCASGGKDGSLLIVTRDEMKKTIRNLQKC